MRAFTGTWRLFRLAVRRDRVKLPIILLVLIGVFYVPSVDATLDFYGKTAEQRYQYAATTAPSIMARAFNGPTAGPEIGSIINNETFIWMALAIAFVSTMAVVRHTRQNEEYGRSELIESGVVARHASIAAALLLVLLINAVVASCVLAVLLGFGLPATGAALTALSLFSVGMVFAGLAAVASQLADSARGANSYAAAMIGAAFLVRAIGDALGTLSQDGLSVESAWWSWLSPFGWAQQIFPFAHGRTWVLAVLGIFFVATLMITLLLMARRDIGTGLIPTRLGRARARRSLLHVLGLAGRMQRGILVGWSAVITIFGMTFGFTIKEFEKFLSENAEMQQAFEQLGFSGNDYSQLFLSILINMMAIVTTGYVVQALLRMRSEESGGQLESVLSARVGRTKWLLSHVLFIYAGVLLLLLLLALSLGLVFILSTGAPIGQLKGIIVASLAQAAPLLAFGGFVVTVFAFVPRLSVALAWGGLAACLMIVQVGALLKLPQIILNISPFVHLPAMPSSEFKLAPVLWLSGIGLALMVIGFMRFKRRDLLAQ